MRLLRRFFKDEPIEHWTDPDDLAAHRRERKRLSENHYNRAQALAAWLLATLVALNGGALAIDPAKAHPTAFVIGAVLAVLSGFASWQEAQDRTGLHYVESIPDHVLTEHGRRQLRLWRRRFPTLRTAALACNWLSLAAFVTGCVIAG